MPKLNNQTTNGAVKLETADLGFPGEGNPKEGAPTIIWPKFALNCMKLKKIGAGRVQNFAM